MLIVVFFGAVMCRVMHFYVGGHVYAYANTSGHHCSHWKVSMHEYMGSTISICLQACKWPHIWSHVPACNFLYIYIKFHYCKHILFSSFKPHANNLCCVIFNNEGHLFPNEGHQLKKKKSLRDTLWVSCMKWREKTLKKENVKSSMLLRYRSLIANLPMASMFTSYVLPLISVNRNDAV